MRSLLALLAAVLAIVPVALAGAVRTVTAPAPVSALAADGPRVAYAAGRSAADCNRVYVWNLTTRRVAKLGRKTHCEQTSTGNAISGLAIAGNRALWAHYVGGNTRDWTLWTATTSRPAPTLLDSVSAAADDAAPILVGNGTTRSGNDLLSYAVRQDVTGLRSTGARAFRWRSPTRVTAIASDESRVVVGRSDGTVVLLSEFGVVYEVYFEGEGAAPATALALSAGRLYVQRGSKLLYSTGDRPDRTLTLPRGSRLVDAEDDRALVVTARGLVQQVEFRPNAVLVRSLGNGRFAQLEPAYTTVAAGRVVRLLPR